MKDYNYCRDCKHLEEHWKVDSMGGQVGGTEYHCRNEGPSPPYPHKEACMFFSPASGSDSSGSGSSPSSSSGGSPSSSSGGSSGCAEKGCGCLFLIALPVILIIVYEYLSALGYVHWAWLDSILS